VELEPKLKEVALPRRPAGAVLVLHGGASRRGNAMVSPTQLSVLRMIPIARRIARAARDRLAVFRLLNSRRGWDTTHTPVADVDWALDRVAEIVGEALPTCLVGHSLGGRAALLAADRAEVRSAVALAPYVYPTDVAARLRGERLLIVHGTRDRIASPARSAALARQLASRASVGYVSVDGGSHAMLARHGVFSALAAAFCTETLLGSSTSATVARLEAGERWLTV
jgi:dienelactone hydrolase